MLGSMNAAGNVLLLGPCLRDSPGQMWWASLKGASLTRLRLEPWGSRFQGEGSLVSAGQCLLLFLLHTQKTTPGWAVQPGCHLGLGDSPPRVPRGCCTHPV